MNGEDLPEGKKKEQWEALKSQRPRLVVEVGCGIGWHLNMIKNEFESGKYSNARYLGVDPDLKESSINKHGFALARRGRVGENVLDDFYGQVDEVWIANIGQIVNKPEEFREVITALKRGGSVYIVDNYTSGLSDKSGDICSFLQDTIGFSSVSDLTRVAYDSPDRINQPFVRAVIDNVGSGLFLAARK